MDKLGKPNHRPTKPIYVRFLGNVLSGTLDKVLSLPSVLDIWQSHQVCLVS